MKLYLSSYLIPDPKIFSEFVGKEQSQIKMGFIFNAKDYKPKKERDRKFTEIVECFKSFGFAVEEINLLDYVDHLGLLEKFKSFDVVWFNGGNTYALRWAIAKSKSEKILKEALESGVVYAGDSAGAIIVGPTLKYYDVADDPTVVPEIIYEGLGFTDIAVLPHWGSIDYALVLGGIEKKLKTDGYKTTRLNDYQCLLIEDGKLIKK